MLPALFVSHGAPTLIGEEIPARDFLAGLGRALARPTAIVVATAHWETDRPALSAAARPETIHDFYGFPEALYRLRYPAPGAPALAEEAVAALARDGIGASVDPDRGFDHGVWSPLLLMYPEADIPVVSLSVQPRRSPAEHIAVGRALASLRERGVLVMGSGGAVHNLGALARGSQGAAPDWATRFDEWLAQAFTDGDVESLANYREVAPHARQAHPRDEHLMPAFVAFGAGGPQARGRRLHRSFAHGSISMAAYAIE